MAHSLYFVGPSDVSCLDRVISHNGSTPTFDICILRERVFRSLYLRDKNLALLLSKMQTHLGASEIVRDSVFPAHLDKADILTHAYHSSQKSHQCWEVTGNIVRHVHFYDDIMSSS